MISTNPVTNENEEIELILQILMAWFIGHRRPASASELARGIGWPIDRIEKLLTLALHFDKDKIDEVSPRKGRWVYSPSKTYLLDQYLKAKGDAP